MGAGKTSIGKQLARRLKRPFHDSDRELERRTGVDIPTIFEYEGEEGFRARESAVIDELTRLQGIVLATGGGAVLKAQNRKRLTHLGFVVYLSTGVDTQLQRTARDRNRPLLQTEDPRARLEALLRVREPFYLEMADLVVDTERSAIPAIVNRIVRQYRELSPHG
jgi:shikimate kinase